MAASPFNIWLFVWLDIRFASADFSSNEDICVGSSVRLTQLYIAGGFFNSYDFAQCITPVSLGISHSGWNKPAGALPTALTWLCLHGTLSARTSSDLEGLSNLVSMTLGGTRLSDALPALPHSVTELDLWDNSLTDPQQLTRLTHLKNIYAQVTSAGAAAAHQAALPTEASGCHWLVIYTFLTCWVVGACQHPCASIQYC